ncbi:hypothetical protein CL656_03220 [bacterium]|nr:hypothetical protein [bacterium]|tara:strand:- start:6596 stop:7105 length:510 start_codon:yes stop_codon:yes gene_type:complete
MRKAITKIILIGLLLAGCTNLPEINTDRFQQKAQVAELKYKLVYPESDRSLYLTFRRDKTFTLDFNMCHFIVQGQGKYNAKEDKYFLDVLSCVDCENNQYNNSIGNDYGLPSVSLELKKISETELKIQNELSRIETGQKLSFCAPSNDPENHYAGVNYNLFKLVENTNF